MNEASSRPWWLALAASVRQLPTDLVVAVVAVLVVDAILLLHVVEGGLRFALGLPVLVFLPGYVLVAVLFPGRPRPSTGASERAFRRIDGVERAALSFAMSLVLLILYALVVDLTPLAFSEPTALGGVTVLVLAGASLGGVRRLDLPASERFRVPFGRWFGAREAVLHPRSWLDGALNVVLLASAVAALGAFGYALAVPAPNAGFTEFQLLTENDAGDLVASGYPSTVEAGEETPLVAAVTNHEGSAQTYTVVVELQQVSATDGEVTVLEETELQRTQSRVGAGETWNWRHAVAPPPTMQGEDRRLQYTLYRGDAPADASADDAYRRLHLWISIDDGG